MTQLAIPGLRTGEREQREIAQPLRRRRRLGPGKQLKFGAALGPILLLAIWSIGSATGVLDPRVLSAPWTVVTTTGDLIADGRLQSNLWTSAQRAFAGLGIGESMKIVTILLGVFVPIYIHTHNGLRTIDSRYVELAQTVGLSRWDFIRRVVLPGALPGFLLGLRFAVTGAWLSLVVVEQINSTSGIGYMMELARTYGQTDIIIVGLVLYGALGLLSDGAVRLIQRRALTWRRTLAS